MSVLELFSFLDRMVRIAIFSRWRLGDLLDLIYAFSNSSEKALRKGLLFIWSNRLVGVVYFILKRKSFVFQAFTISGVCQFLLTRQMGLCHLSSEPKKLVGFGRYKIARFGDQISSWVSIYVVTSSRCQISWASTTNMPMIVVLTYYNDENYCHWRKLSWECG